MPILSKRRAPATGVYFGANAKAKFWWFNMNPLGARRLPLLIFAFVAAVGLERGALHSDISGSSALLQYILLFCLIGYWLDVDSREKRTLRVWDMGFFLYVAWPFILPYYLVKTRGIKRMLLTLLLITVVYVGASLVGTTISRLAK
jgi:hypothetical protein